jgi:hypothetical protein
MNAGPRRNPINNGMKVPMKVSDIHDFAFVSTVGELSLLDDRMMTKSSVTNSGMLFFGDL